MLKLSAPQNIFLNELNTKFRGYVGGYGSGKTFVGCLDLLLFAGTYPGYAQAYYGPTYAAIKDIFYPTLEEAAELLGFVVEVMLTDKVVHLYRNGAYYGSIICRSMDKPSTIVGYKVARSLVDEIDTLDHKKAKKAWDKIIARLRVKVPGVINGVGVTTTPEGFGFVYERFAENPTASYSMVQASTYENAENLPEDYISSLLETYDAALVSAYLNGDFVNLTSGTVYKQFNRTLNATDVTEDGHEALYVGMDFNVEKMAAIVHVLRDGLPRAVGELFDLYDTPAMIDALQARYPDRTVYVYPDASGRGRSTVDALKNDLALLEQAGFIVCVNASNPRVKARITAMNSMFCNAKGERRYLVNVEQCPRYVKCLERQAYDDKGEPDKKAGYDHGNDAAGYFIATDFPVERPTFVPPVRKY